MKRIIKALGLVILIHLFAVYFSYLIFSLINLDFYTLFNQELLLAFTIHAISVGFLYAMMRWVLGKWYKDAYQYPFQGRILFGLLFVAYAIVFIAENQGYSYWEYLFWFNYPLGIFFKTVNAHAFDFKLKIIFLLGIGVQALLLVFADALDRLFKRIKKKSLRTSLTK